MIVPTDRDSLIATHYFLCSRAARKFLRDGVERADLEQIAAIGLIKAADRFVPEQGTPFEAYAWVLILGELMHYVRDSERLLRAPRRIRDLEKRWARAEQELWVLLGREAKGDELVQYLAMSHDDAREVMRYREIRSIVSVDAVRGQDHRALSYTIETQLDRFMVEAGFRELSVVQREILVEIYERDTPIMEIARRLGYSRRHIARLHRDALKKLSPFACPISA